MKIKDLYLSIIYSLSVATVIGLFFWMRFVFFTPPDVIIKDNANIISQFHGLCDDVIGSNQPMYPYDSFNDHTIAAAIEFIPMAILVYFFMILFKWNRSSTKVSLLIRIFLLLMICFATTPLWLWGAHYDEKAYEYDVQNTAYITEYNKQVPVKLKQCWDNWDSRHQADPI